MDIMIWDIDWFYKTSQIPSMDCMQISSYHKQLGDYVGFVENEIDLMVKYDILYVSRNSNKSPMPKKNIWNDERVRLLGNGFKYHKMYVPPKPVYCCRPDYLLYPQSEDMNSYTNANFIRFYWNGELLTVRQDFHNTKKRLKRLIVYDDGEFWKASEKNLLYCLETLKSEKNIAFLKPIPLKRLLTSENIRKKFLELNFSIGTAFQWRNDWGSSPQAVSEILDFMDELNEKTKSDLGFVPVKAIEEIPESEEQAINRFLECLGMVCEGKKRKEFVRIIIPKEFTNAPRLRLFKILESWTSKMPKLSLVEFITHNSVKQYGMIWYEILNSPSKWTLPFVDELLRFLGSPQYKKYHPLFFCQWGINNLNSLLVRYDIIEKNKNLLL